MRKDWFRLPLPFLPMLLRSNLQNYGEVHLSNINDIKSNDGGDPVKVVFRNHSNQTLLLCWVTPQGQPKHFYLLEPQPQPNQSKSKYKTQKDHLEHTQTGHAFWIATAKDPLKCQQAKSLQDATLVAAYRPTSNKHSLQCVTIQSPISTSTDCCSCSPTFLRKRKRSDNTWKLSLSPLWMDQRIIDTRKQKTYYDTTIAGWNVKMDQSLNDNTEFHEIIAQDLQHATICLPPHAKQRLQQDTTIWINNTFTYGSISSPQTPKGLCFHPQLEWLQDNAMHTEKYKCIELYNAKHYQTVDRQLWGPGGVLLHELSHAYHHKCIDKGYDNPDIEECWNQAMKDKLYDNVKVHGTQGPEARAYACTNHLEYWAELSTALLGGDDESIEYNKWFPFNRAQLKKHDPRAYKLLTKLWKTEFN